MSKTSKLKLLKYILSLFIFGLTNIASGQINLKVGYAFGHSNLEQTTSLFNNFNADNPQAEKVLSPITNYHGIELGTRYKFKHFGIELGLSSVSASTEALNVFQPDGSLGSDEWKISIINYSIGLENYFGNFGYGANIGYQKLKYKADIDGSKSKKTVFNESVLNSKFYLILEVPSDKVAFSIRPFISTTWEPYNIKAVELVFAPQSTLPKSDFDQNVIVYGVSFLFYNGPKNR
jgi:hypothetical protein